MGRAIATVLMLMLVMLRRWVQGDRSKLLAITARAWVVSDTACCMGLMCAQTMDNELAQRLKS